MQRKKYFIIFTYCKRAMRVLKNVSVKLIAYLLQGRQHLFLVSFGNSFNKYSLQGAQILFQDAAVSFAPILMNIILDTFQKILRKKKSKNYFFKILFHSQNHLRLVYAKKNRNLFCMCFRTLRIFRNKTKFGHFWWGGG